MDFSPVDEIKNRLDILEVIGSYIKLTKAGRNYKARCPFHSERTPSFMVSPERQIWHCFGCGKGGSIFNFVMEIEGVEFGDALRTLASRAGVVLRRQDPQIQTQRQRLYEICELAAKFFEKQLEASNAGKKAKQYLLKDRGLKSDTAKQWRLGFAPDGWRNLYDFLRQRGYKDNEIFDAGVTVKKNSDIGGLSSDASEDSPPHCYDRFRSRIMFPIFDIQGQVVGFAGRLFGKMDENVGKYINTPQTILYDKSKILYGLNFAKIDLRQKNSCIFVEGNLDVIMSHQAGTKNVVASSGTALTEEHLKITKRYTDNLVFAFDMDLAGETATKRSIDLALENDFNIKVIQIGEKDPADLIKSNPAKWAKAVEQAVSIMVYYFDSTFVRHPSKNSGQVASEDKKQIAKILLPVIKKISNQIERAHWIGELGKRIKTDEKTLYAEMEKIKTVTYSSSTASDIKTVAEPAEAHTRQQELEEQLLSLCLNFPKYLNSLDEEPKNLISNQDLIEIFEEFIVAAKNLSKEQTNCHQLLEKKLSAPLYQRASFLLLKLELLPLDESLIEKEIKNCVKELKIIKIKDEMNRLSFEIMEAQTDNNSKSLEKNLSKFNYLSQELIKLTND